MKKSAEDGLRGNKSPSPPPNKTPSTKSDTGKKVLSAARLISPVDAIASAAESGAHLRRGNLKAAGVAALGVGVALGGGALISKARKAASTPLKKSGEEMLKRGKEFGSPAANIERSVKNRMNTVYPSSLTPAYGTHRFTPEGNKAAILQRGKVAGSAEGAIKRAGDTGRAFGSVSGLAKDGSNSIRVGAVTTKTGVRPGAPNSRSVSYTAPPVPKVEKSILERGKEFGSAGATADRMLDNYDRITQPKSALARVKSSMSKRKMRDKK